MQAIQTSLDEVVSTLLKTLRQLTAQSVEPKEPAREGDQMERLYQKNGILVAETGRLDEFDTNDSIKQMRDERH